MRAIVRRVDVQADGLRLLLHRARIGHQQQESRAGGDRSDARERRTPRASPSQSISAPEISAAAARPRLPHSPFQPSARPIFSGAATSIAMPTGW